MTTDHAVPPDLFSCPQFAAVLPVRRPLSGATTRRALTTMHEHAEARQFLAHNLIERFVAVDDEHYDDIRAMQAACQQAGFLTLR